MWRSLYKILLKLFNGDSKEVLIRSESGITRTLRIETRDNFTLTFKSKAFLYKETFTRFYRPNSYFYIFDVYTDMTENTPHILKKILSNKISFKVPAIKEDLFPDREWDRRMKAYIEDAISKARAEISLLDTN